MMGDLLERLLVHVKAAVNLNLKHVNALVRLAVVLGYVAPSIGLVQEDAIAKALQESLNESGDFRRT